MRVPISVINNVKKLESIIIIMYVVVILRTKPGACNLQVCIVHEKQDFEYLINAKPQLGHFTMGFDFRRWISSIHSTLILHIIRKTVQVLKTENEMWWNFVHSLCVPKVVALHMIEPDRIHFGMMQNENNTETWVLYFLIHNSKYERLSTIIKN